MPGPVSDSYDPEFGTAGNAANVAEAILETKIQIDKALNSELKSILNVVDGKKGPMHAIELNERQLRIIRFCLSRTLECI